MILERKKKKKSGKTTTIIHWYILKGTLVSTYNSFFFLYFTFLPFFFFRFLWRKCNCCRKAICSHFFIIFLSSYFSVLYSK